MIEERAGVANTTVFSSQSPVWYRALDLPERIACLRTMAGGARPRTDALIDAAAHHNLQSWKEQPPFHQASLFADRLASDQITEQELLYLLGEPIELVRACLTHLPGWLAQLAEICERWNEAEGFAIPLAASVENQTAIEFLKLVKPYVRHGIEQLNAGIADLSRNHSYLPFDPDSITALLCVTLPGQIVPRLTRTMALEVNVARLRGRLQGATPEARFESFVQQLGQRDEIVPLLEEYPVLARQLVVAIEQWVNYGLEFLRHLCADWEDLCAKFASGSDPGPLVEIEGDAGERHRGGRSVLKLRFHSGLQLVYKPRSLAVDVHFQELLAWLNQRGHTPQFRTLSVVNRGTHGWVEFVQAGDCRSREEVERFYERQGGYLALLYALEATDFHCENLIAAGEDPVLIDLEALFQPRVNGYDLKQYEDPAVSMMGYSVLRVGFLPERIAANEQSQGIDASALGGKAGQLSPGPIGRWEGFGTDQMRIVQRQVLLDSAHNRPTLNGGDVEVMDYLDHVVRGFSQTYRLLMEWRADFLSGPLLRFHHDEIRVIVRSTKTYNSILRQSFHPDLLRNALARDRFLDHLWRTVEHRPYMAQLIPAERAELRDGDVPLFTSRVDTRHIYTGSGQRIADFFDEPSLEVVKKRIQELSLSDLDRQLWFIRASFATIPLGKGEPTWKSSRLLPSESPVTRERLLAAAQAVGDRLGMLAIEDRNLVNWVGLSLQHEGWQLLPASVDLYNGTSGIAMFLAYLGALTGEARYTVLARSALTSIQRQIEQLKRWQGLTSMGVFTGVGAPIYVFAHLAALWNEPALLDEAEALVGLLPELIEKDDLFDVIGGSAGCIHGLLSLYQVRPTAATLDIAVQCGNHLLRHAQPMEEGVGWHNATISDVPLTGFSHGAAGIALSLLELAHVCGDERFRQTAVAALAYERSIFSAQHQNWPDLRKIATQIEAAHYITTWCHGAAGIGLGRLASLKHHDEPVIRQEIETAIQTTLREGFGLNHCLCHGDLGNLELLLVASQVLDNPDYQNHLSRLTAMVLDSIDRQGWSTGMPLGLESPGLMSGLAGIGYGLLRLAEPAHVPSVLLLAPPGRT